MSQRIWLAGFRSISIAPPVSGTTPTIALSNVLLPAPFGPIIATSWPGSTPKVTADKAISLPKATINSRQSTEAPFSNRCSASELPSVDMINAYHPPRSLPCGETQQFPFKDTVIYTPYFTNMPIGDAVTNCVAEREREGMAERSAVVAWVMPSQPSLSTVKCDRHGYCERGPSAF